MEHPHHGHRQRLRERLAAEGLAHFQPHEAMELILSYAIPQRDVNELAHRVIAHFGSFASALEASPQALMEVPGIGERTASFVSLLPQLTRFYQQSRFGDRPRLTNFKRAGEYCKTLYIGETYESLHLLCLDAAGSLICPVRIHEGTLDETPFYPRLIVEAALRHKAHSVVISHNHPAGTLLASPEDIESTELLILAMETLHIQVLDHIIVAGDQFLSMHKHNLLPQHRPGRRIAEPGVFEGWREEVEDIF